MHALKLTPLALIFVLSGCATPNILSSTGAMFQTTVNNTSPFGDRVVAAETTKESCLDLTNNEMDDFQSVSFSSAPACIYRSPAEAPIVGLPRIIKNKKTGKKIYQVYVYANPENWIFLDSYRYMFKENLEPVKKLTQIDRDVGYGLVYEHLVFEVSKERFKHFSENDMKLRLYGKNANETIVVPANRFKQVLEHK